MAQLGTVREITWTEGAYPFLLHSGETVLSADRDPDVVSLWHIVVVRVEKATPAQRYLRGGEITNAS